MIDTRIVIGTQKRMPSEIEFNNDSVYIRRDIQKVQAPDAEADSRVNFQYEETVFTREEYESIIAGVLPGTMTEWTDVARWVERRAMLDDVDRLISEAESEGLDAQDSNGRVDALMQVKAEIRATKSQSGYPWVVEYPDIS